MDVLILGGTGAIGKPLVKNCIDVGHDAYVTSRRERVSDNKHLTYITLDAHSKKLETFLKDKVFDCVVDFMSYSLSEFKKQIDIILPRTKQYIFISSARVFDDSVIINEDSPRLLDSSTDEIFLNTEEYSLTKAREEELLANSRYNNWVIVRPYITYNDERFQLGYFEKEDWLIRAINGNTVIVPEDILDKKTTMTFGPDVARCIFSLIGKENTLGQSINITTDESYTWETVLKYYQTAFEETFGHAFKYKIKGNKETFSKIFSGQKYQINYCRMFNRVFDNTKCRGYTGGALNFTPLYEGLKHSLRQFKQMGMPFDNIEPFKQAYFDRIAHETTKLELFKTKKTRCLYVCSRYIPLPYGMYKKIYSIFF